jgi:hypothetical protein
MAREKNMAEQDMTSIRPEVTKGEPYQSTVTVVTAKRNVRTPAMLEEASNLFKQSAKDGRLALTSEPELVGIEHVIGSHAVFTFKAETKK